MFAIASAGLAFGCVHNNATLNTEIQYTEYCHASYTNGKRSVLLKNLHYFKSSVITFIQLLPNSIPESISSRALKF